MFVINESELIGVEKTNNIVTNIKNNQNSITLQCRNNTENMQNVILFF